MFDNASQRKDWDELHRQIDEMPHPPACENDPELFFPETTIDYYDRQAINRACGSCPVQKACFSYGVKWNEIGIWGGVRLTLRNNSRWRE